MLRGVAILCDLWLRPFFRAQPADVILTVSARVENLRESDRGLLIGDLRRILSEGVVEMAVPTCATIYHLPYDLVENNVYMEVDRQPRVVESQRYQRCPHFHSFNSHGANSCLVISFVKCFATTIVLADDVEKGCRLSFSFAL